MGWGADAQLLYRLLIEVHWIQRGILPRETKKLRLLSRLDWSTRHFNRVFAEIQDCQWGAKFREDKHGLYNQKGRDMLLAAWESRVNVRVGKLRQWGYQTCRERDRPNKLGNGWVRICPSCHVDLWTDFEKIPWLERQIFPGKTAPERPPPIAAKKAAEPPPVVARSASNYVLEIEEIVQETLETNRIFSAEETKLVEELGEDGIPVEVVGRTIRDTLRRFKLEDPNKSIGTIKYFLVGKQGGAIRTAWRKIQRLQEPEQLSVLLPEQDAVTVVESEEWGRILEELAKLLTSEELEIWFRPLRVVTEEVSTNGKGSQIKVAAPTRSIASIIQCDFYDVLTEAAGGSTVEIESPKEESPQWEM